MLLSQASQDWSARQGAPSLNARQSFTVSEALTKAQHALEGLRLRVTGEVSEVSAKPSYKAAYFTIKDQRAALPCMMWMNHYKASGVQLLPGMLVDVEGQFSVYPPQGKMEFKVDALSTTGEGELRRRVAQLAGRLQAEGLMDQSRKRPLPQPPLHVGLVTSPIGDAVHDVLRTFRRRWQLARISFAGVHVEGLAAPAEIIEGLHACVDAGCDVIVLVRGGGSYESLMPFNDEHLARAVAACPVPVVTGIGHERDNTIADMVSDLRASTPTGAALQVTPDKEALVGEIDAVGQRMARALRGQLERSRLMLERLASRPVLADPTTLFATDAVTLDLMHDRLNRAMTGCLERYRLMLEQRATHPVLIDPSMLLATDAAKVERMHDRLGHTLPARLAHERVSLNQLHGRLKGRGRGLCAGAAQTLAADEKRLRVRGASLISGFERDVALRAGRLHDLSPLAVIARGYALVRDKEGSLVKRTSDVECGQSLKLAVSDGHILCTVDETLPESQA